VDINTHEKISKRLVGRPIEVVRGTHAVVELNATNEMAVDLVGLTHGGFTFGLADYAAMLAVNHPNVVLGSAQVKSLLQSRPAIR
jgi:acyl-coenzyme A thioesterase PaaI-like protein